MKKWLAGALSIVVALPAAIYAVIQIQDRSVQRSAPVKQTIRIDKVVKIQWPGHKPERTRHDDLADQIKLACNNKQMCGYDHVFSSSNVGKLEVSWTCTPGSSPRVKVFNRRPREMKTGGEPIRLVLDC